MRTRTAVTRESPREIQRLEKLLEDAGIRVSAVVSDLSGVPGRAMLEAVKVAYLAIGVDLEGRKHASGVWIQDSEGAKFWQKVVINLRNRGVRDILIACCDGLT